MSLDGEEATFTAPDRREVPHRVSAETLGGATEDYLERMSFDLTIDEDTGASRWNGEEPDYSACVEWILRAKRELGTTA